MFTGYYCPPPPSELEEMAGQVEDCDECGYLPLRREIEEYVVALDGKEFPREPAQEPPRTQTIEEKFLELAEKWESQTKTSSSNRDMTLNPSYREIVALGWRALPYILRDLERNQRFWFPALYEITNVRPFDPKDAGNGKRMVKAWLEWGKRKELI